MMHICGRLWLAGIGGVDGCSRHWLAAGAEGADGAGGAQDKGWIAEEVLRQVRALREQNAAIKKELSAVRKKVSAVLEQ